MDMNQLQNNSYAENKVPFVERNNQNTFPLVVINNGVQFPYRENYGPYLEFIDTGYQVVNLNELNASNWRLHMNSVVNIMKDGIESDFLRTARFHIVFTDGIELNLTIFDYFFNLIFWNLILSVGDKIRGEHLFFEEAITKKSIKKYIDEKFIDTYRIPLNNIEGTNPEAVNILLNNIIDTTLYEFSNIDEFSMYLANTINLEDDLELMKKYPETYDFYHADLSGVRIEDVKNAGMDITNKLIEYIKNSDHCLADSFRAGEGINPRQYKEVFVNIGSKPDGKGGIFPFIINNSFTNGGVKDISSFYIDSDGGRTAQIIAKCNVGTSGHFARLLGLNNRDTILHPYPEYDCHTKNYEKIFMKNENFLRLFENRFYRFSPDGVEYKLSLKDTHLIGKTLLFRSPMTCASHSRGRGICYKCYGDLAYTNSSINIGQYAAEALSSALTQRLLSAKHLLEARVEKFGWPKEFNTFFEIIFNIIRLNDTFDYRGYKLCIDQNNIDIESEEDNYEYNEYITSFEVLCPDGVIIPIYTKNLEHIYISNELNDVIRKHGESADGKIEIDMESITDINLFLIRLTNNELSKTLEMIKTIINNNEITCSHDKDSILQRFVETVLDGGLDTIAVHLEVILSNQLRSTEDILSKPDWDNVDEQYKLITLNSALTDNPSITVSMDYQKLAKVFYNPLSFKKTKPSFMDLLFMEKPQMYMLNKSLINDDWKPVSDKEEPKPLVSFEKEENK